MSKYVHKFWFEGQLALALGALMLLGAVALADPVPGAAVAWPIDEGTVLNNKICQSADAACTHALNVCYKTALKDSSLEQYGPYFKTTSMRQHGTCSTGSNSGGDQCTQYPQFTCAYISFYQNVGCKNFLRGVYIVIGPNFCDAS